MIRRMLQDLMQGRYGSDALNAVLTVVCLLLLLLDMALPLYVFDLLGLVLLCWAIFRMLSRNFEARQAENAKFLKLVGPVLQWLRLQRNIRMDKEHRYFKCPNCGQQLRVPKGKGKITVKCRSCGACFEEKS